MTASSTCQCYRSLSPRSQPFPASPFAEDRGKRPTDCDHIHMLSVVCSLHYDHSEFAMPKTKRWSVQGCRKAKTPTALSRVRPPPSLVSAALIRRQLRATA